MQGGDKVSGGIEVKEFKHIPGVNDAEYIRLLEEHRKIDRDIINKAVAKIKSLSAELREQPEIIRCKDCAFYEKEIGGNDGFALGMCKFIEQHYVANEGFCFWAKKKGEENERD